MRKYHNVSPMQGLARSNGFDNVRRNLRLALSGSVLSVCSPRGLFSISPEADAGIVQPIWAVASDASVRVPVDKASKATIASISPYERLEISIPSNHRRGQLEWPSAQLDPQNDFFCLQAGKIWRHRRLH